MSVYSAVYLSFLNFKELCNLGYKLQYAFDGCDFNIIYLSFSVILLSVN